MNPYSEGSDVQLDAVVNKLPILLACVNANTLKYKFVNNAYQKSFGIPLDKIIGSHIKTILGETGYKLAIKYIREAKKGKSLSYERYFDMKNGKRWMKVDYIPNLDKENKVASIIVLSYDITEQKKAEEELKKQKQFVESMINLSNDISYIYDIIEKKNVYVNDGIRKVLGYSISDIQKMGSKLLPILMHPDDMKAYLKEIIPKYSKVKDDEIIPNEYRMKHKNGKWIWLECSEQIYNRLSNGKPQQIFGVIHNITEQKKTEEELKESEGKYKLLVDKMQEITVILNKTGKILFVNNFALRTLGYTEKEMLGKSVFNYLTKDSVKKAIYNLGQEFLGKNTGSIEIDVITKKGERRTIAIGEESNPIYEDKKVVELLINGIDITERKKAEEELKESKERLLEAQRMSKIGYWDWDIKTGDVKWSEEIFRIFQLDPKNFVPHIDSILNLSPWPDDHARDKELIRKATENHENGSYEQKFLRPDKSTGYYYSTFHGSYDNKGRLISIIGTVMDITERKKAEEELLASKSKLDLALKSAQMGVWQLDIIKGKLYFDNQTCLLLGINPTIFKGTSNEFYKVVHPDDAKIIQRALNNTINNNTLYEPEYRVIWPDGSTHYIAARAELTRDKEGKPKFINGILWDITKRKKTEQDLQEFKSINDSIVENIPLMIFLKDAKDLKFVVFNRAGENLLGYNRQDLIGKNDMNLFPQKQAAFFIAKDREVLNGKTGSIDISEEPIKTVKKGERILHTRKVCILGSDDTPRYLLGISEDITERKKAEEELKKSKEVLQSKNEELEKFNKLAVGRELKMIELKEKIKELEDRLGKNS